MEEELKQEYNKLLKRFYNGCNYIEEHMNEINKYEPIVHQILKKMNEILSKINKKTDEEVLNGFK